MEPKGSRETDRCTGRCSSVVDSQLERFASHYRLDLLGHETSSLQSGIDVSRVVMTAGLPQPRSKRSRMRWV